MATAIERQRIQIESFMMTTGVLEECKYEVGGEEEKGRTESKQGFHFLGEGKANALQHRNVYPKGDEVGAGQYKPGFCLTTGAVWYTYD